MAVLAWWLTLALTSGCLAQFEAPACATGPTPLPLNAGTLTYPPSYGDVYLAGLNCTWNITVTDDSAVRITWNRMELAIDGTPGCVLTDYVAFFDGPNINAPELGRFCGTEFNLAYIVRELVSSGPIVTVQFVSTDLYYHGPYGYHVTGFSIDYAPTHDPVQKTCSGFVDLTATSNGTIIGVEQGGDTTYSAAPNFACAWRLRGSVYMEAFVADFQASGCQRSHVITFYDGVDDTAPVLAEFDDRMAITNLGSNYYHVYSTQPYMYITAVNLDGYVGLPLHSFSIRYARLNAPITLVGDSQEYSGTDQSFPAFPRPFDGSTTYSGPSCEISYFAASRTIVGNRLSFYFLSLDLAPLDTITLYDGSYNNGPVLAVLNSASMAPLGPFNTTDIYAYMVFSATSFGDSGHTGYRAHVTRWNELPIQCWDPAAPNDPARLQAPYPYLNENGWDFRTDKPCSWLLTSPGQVMLEYIDIFFKTRNVGCPSQRINIYDGVNASAPLITSLCNLLSYAGGFRIISTGPNLFIAQAGAVSSWTRDDRMSIQVFNLTTPTPPIYYCGNLDLTADNGTFSVVTPYNASTSPAFTLCKVILHAPGAAGYALRFLDYDATTFHGETTPWKFFRGNSTNVADQTASVVVRTDNPSPTDVYIVDAPIATAFHSVDFFGCEERGALIGYSAVRCPVVPSAGRTDSGNSTHVTTLCYGENVTSEARCNVTAAQWVAPLLGCEFCDVPLLVNGHCEGTTRNGTLLRVGETLSCTCDDGYLLSTNIFATCNTDNEALTVPTCISAFSNLNPLVSSLRPQITPLAGGPITLTGFGWVVPVVAAHTALTTYVASNLTSDATTVTFMAGPSPAKGYQPVTFTDVAGNNFAAYPGIYYSDDCPTEGYYGIGANCHPCPEGGYCPGGNRIWPLPGYWNSGEEAGYVVACPDPSQERCLGGRNSTCGPAYTGVTCAQCINGYYESGIQCIPCPPASSQAALYAVSAVLFAILSVCIVFLKDTQLNYVVSAFKLLQALRTAGVKSGNVLPEGMRYINDYLSLITFDYNFLQPACGVEPETPKFATIFWGNAVVLLVLIAPSFITLGGLAAFDKKRHTQWKDRAIRALIVFAYLIYFIVATRTLQAVTCTTIGDDHVLRADTTTLCRDGGFAGTATVGAIGIGLFVVAVPALSWAVLLRLSRTDRLLDDATHARFGYLFRRLRLDRFRFLYEPLGLVHLFFLALAWNVFPSGRSSYAFAIFSYSLMLVVVTLWRPFERARGAAFAVFSFGLGLTSAVSNIMTLNAGQYTAGASIATVVVLGFATVLAAIGTFVCGRNQARSRGKGSKESKQDTDSASLSSIAAPSMSSISASTSGTESSS